MIRTARPDDVGRAIAWLLLGVSSGLVLDLCAKELLRTYSLQEFILIRSGIAISIFIALAYATLSARDRRHIRILLRTVKNAIGQYIDAGLPSSSVLSAR